MKPTTYETLEERNARVFSQFNIFNLREMSDEELRHGEFLLMGKDLSIIDCGNENFIDWFLIKSGNKTHKVHKFYNFVCCDCESFFFNKYCPHVSATFPPTCQCGREINERGGQCQRCDERKSLYQKIEKPSEKINGFRL